MAATEKYGLLIGHSASVYTIWTLEDGETTDYHLWPNGTYRTSGIPPVIGDVVRIGRNEITKEPHSMLQVRHIPAEGEERERFEANVNFVPLNHSLYPGRAKEKNLVLAYCRELCWYAPIVVKNGYGKHKIYNGLAYFYPPQTRTPREDLISRTYQTDWFLYTGAQLASEEHAQSICTFHTGVVLDSSLKDVFMVFNEETGIVSLKKELCEGKNITIGSWVKFVYLDVKEGEKADETKEVFPTDYENWTIFERRIAFHPIKVREEPYPTRAISEKQIEIIHEFEVPVNPAHATSYTLPLLGTFTDEKGLVGVKNEASVLRVKIRSQTSNHCRAVNFYLEEIIEHQQPIVQRQPELPTPSPPRESSFLESIDRARIQRCGGNARSRSRAPMAPINNTNNSGMEIQSEQREQAVHPEQLELAQQVQHGPSARIPPKEHQTCVGIVVQRFEHYVLAFAPDGSLVAERIARLTRSEINPLPAIGQWVKIIMEKNATKHKIATKHREPEYIVWGAERIEAVYETHVGENDRVLVRAPLNVRNSDENFSVKELGVVSNEKNRLPIKAGYKKVWAWCEKIQSPDCRVDPCNRIHWEIARTPSEDWVETTPPPVAPPKKFVPSIQTTIGYVGKRYREEREKNQPKDAPKEEVVHLRTSAPSTNMIHWEIPAQNSTEAQAIPDLYLIPSTSGTSRPKSASPMETSTTENDNNNVKIDSIRKQPSPPTFQELCRAHEIDLIDLHAELPAVPEPEQQQEPMEEDKPVNSQATNHHLTSSTTPASKPVLAPIQTTKSHHQPAPKSAPDSTQAQIPLNLVKPAMPNPTSMADDQEFSYMGVVASLDNKTSGYYVFCKELCPREVFLWRVRDSINIGTWIRFNLTDDPRRLMVSDYVEMDASPYFVKSERNTIIMFVKSTIPVDFDASQPLTTEYVPMVYDINCLIYSALRGKTCLLKIKRHRRPGNPYNWEVVAVMQVCS